MSYKVKNITDSPLTFEGITVPAQSISGELDLERYQRLLALYYPFTLVPDDQVTEEKPVEVIEEPAPQVEVTTQEEPSPQEEPVVKKGRPRKTK